MSTSITSSAESLSKASEEAVARIKVLNERVWEGRVPASRMQAWLGNFSGEVFTPERERLLALSLLASFSYYGDKEVRALLVSLYRDCWRYNEIQRQLRINATSAIDSEALEILVESRLRQTRFLGMGNPSESGSHLLYYYRQENSLPKDLFVNHYELLDFSAEGTSPVLRDPSIDHLVFIDDVLGSGSQATTYSRNLLPLLRGAASRSGTELRIDYLVMFAKRDGLDDVRKLDNAFDEVRTVHVIDPSEGAFDTRSRLLSGFESDEEWEDARRVAEHYGSALFPNHALGWKDGQLLLGFHHNIPNNTLPIFWDDEVQSVWEPVFPRYRKIDL